MTVPPVEIGLERCAKDPPQMLVGSRFGLLCNHASVDAQQVASCDVLAAAMPGQLASIFSPQHGFWGEQQANMDETPHGVYPPLGVPLYSLYWHHRRPTVEMLDGLDCFVIDLQDVGTRVYTFIWTVSHCLDACAERGIPVIVLDRPNPLGGQAVEGPLVKPGYESFVGRQAIPMRHALTLGEMATWLNQQIAHPATLAVVTMRGWRRDMLWPDCKRPWLPTSPNLPRIESLLLYPGQVLLEGTNLSEGRGTTTPFELVGAPFVDPHTLTRALVEMQLPGIKPVATRFRPMFEKWEGSSCGGVALRVTDPRRARSYIATISSLSCVKRLWPAELKWLPPPYEYELEKMPIDILSGSSQLRESLDSGVNSSESWIAELAAVDVASWEQITARSRLYS